MPVPRHKTKFDTGQSLKPESEESGFVVMIRNQMENAAPLLQNDERFGRNRTSCVQRNKRID